MNADGKMDRREFSIAMYLIKRKLQGFELPASLPVTLLQSLDAPGRIVTPLPSGFATVPRQMPASSMIGAGIATSTPPGWLLVVYDASILLRSHYAIMFCCRFT